MTGLLLKLSTAVIHRAQKEIINNINTHTQDTTALQSNIHGLLLTTSLAVWFTPLLPL
jgi:hypothetical protein